MTVPELAKMLYEEFDRDGWGDIDPNLFGMVGLEMTGDEELEDEDTQRDLKGLVAVLERVVMRINARGRA